MAEMNDRPKHEVDRINRNARKAYMAVRKHKNLSHLWNMTHPEVRDAYCIAAEAILVYENVIPPRPH